MTFVFALKYDLFVTMLKAHVDATAAIVSRTPDGDSLRLLFKLAPPLPETPPLIRYIIPKGYIAIDGASLTVIDVDDSQQTFSIMLIQHTQEKITLSKKDIGEKVNIEVDMVGKYVEKSVVAALDDLKNGGGEGLKAIIRNVVKDVLSENKST